MNTFDSKYSGFLLIKEMMETVETVRNFNRSCTKEIAQVVDKQRRLFLTGEGSSRIFPAKNLIRKSLQKGSRLFVATDGARQASEYDLSDFVVFCASNSGKTKEVISLAKKLVASGHKWCYGLTANEGTLLEQTCTRTFKLNCGKEQTVAATKSVIEQALFYESILEYIQGKDRLDTSILADAIYETLTMPIDNEIVDMATRTPIIYFAGYNDGVAEELTLKTNEITRKKSDYLEGTYAVHGIEEVMNPNEVVVIVDPIDEEIDKFNDVLVKGVGLDVIAIANRETAFPTIKVPDIGDLTPYVYLCAGWNLLVEIGLSMEINLDKPQRARKVGNEFVG